MARIVLSDASPLVGLAIMDGLGWLPALFGHVVIPPSVRRDVLPGVGARGEAEIAAALGHKHLRVWGKAIPEAPADLPELDAGETDCIRIALAQRPGEALVLMDERAGRAVAHERGLCVAGTAALIGLAKQRGLVVSAKARFARLHATDFRIAAAIIQQALRNAGES